MASHQTNVLRKGIQRFMAQGIGFDSRQPRWNPSQQGYRGLEGALMGLPVAEDGYIPAQDSGGNFYSVLDFSTLDGPDSFS